MDKKTPLGRRLGGHCRDTGARKVNCPAEGKAIDAAAEFKIGPCRTTA